MGSTQAQFLVTLALRDPRTGEARNLGEWDSHSGGEVDSDDSTYRAAGGRRVVLSSQIDPSTITLARNYELQRDHQHLGWLLGLVGIGRATITQVPTDAGFAVARGARPLVWANAQLKRVAPPEVDSDSDDAAMIELEFVPEGAAKVA